MKKLIIILVTTAVVLAATYFIRQDRTDATANIAPLSGMDLWKGAWTSNKTKAEGDFFVWFRKDGPDISGNIKIGGSPVTKGGEITGTMEGDKLEFGLVKDKKGELQYAGTISEDRMDGTWKIPALKDDGTWHASKKLTDSPDG